MPLPPGHHPLTLQYVELADLPRLAAARAAGLTDDEILSGLLLFVAPLVNVDDYARFVDDLRAAPDRAWTGAADPPVIPPRRLAS